MKQYMLFMLLSILSLHATRTKITDYTTGPKEIRIGWSEDIEDGKIYKRSMYHIKQLEDERLNLHSPLKVYHIKQDDSKWDNEYPALHYKTERRCFAIMNENDLKPFVPGKHYEDDNDDITEGQLCTLLFKATKLAYGNAIGLLVQLRLRYQAKERIIPIYNALPEVMFAYKHRNTKQPQRIEQEQGKQTRQEEFKSPVLDLEAGKEEKDASVKVSTSTSQVAALKKKFDSWMLAQQKR